ncbi:hypothetical protein [Acinetobacter sp. FDAARGOS_541]|uniref:hypothetical protein n=1 Tax=Acinetobacter sp. FDAARGOS_541 TaxID=2420312 RepID=UPI00148B7DA3|nr:hypothetical protein [Acinetobacter sp. FDAARGOS_541]
MNQEQVFQLILALIHKVHRSDEIVSTIKTIQKKYSSFPEERLIPLATLWHCDKV